MDNYICFSRVEKKNHNNAILIQIIDSYGIIDNIVEIINWFKTTNSGDRMAYDMWRVKSEEDLGMFILRFNAREIKTK